MRLLIVDDDPNMLELLGTYLAPHYDVDRAKNGRDAYSLVQRTNYDLILLDRNMPHLDGVTLCKRLRAESHSVPIIIVTAADAVQQCIEGLNAGADDYVTKPLQLDELLARVQALLRRSGGGAAQTKLKVGDLALDEVAREVSFRGEPLRLTPREYALLELFMHYPKRVFSRAELINRLWSDDSQTLEESVKAHIKSLRKKLDATGAQGWLQTVYGMGYRLAPD